MVNNKHQSECYRIINGKLYRNFCDVFSKEKIEQVKAENPQLIFKVVKHKSVVWQMFSRTLKENFQEKQMLKTLNKFC